MANYLCFTIPILLVSLCPKPTSSIPLPNIPQFGPNLLLIGDARPDSASSSVQLTDPAASSSSGLLIQSKPFTFRASNSSPTTAPSFSTDFVFSISPHNGGDGLALIIVPADFPPRFSRDGFGLSRQGRYVAVEYDTFANGEVRDENANHVGVDVGSLDSAIVRNVSMINLVLSSGMKLHSWVDYDASSKRLEVRLCGFGSSRPYNPLLAYNVDLEEIWKGEEILVGLSSSCRNPMQSTNVYSWKFSLRSVPKWLHSQPLNPDAFSSERAEDRMADEKMVYLLRFVSGFILAALILLLLRLVLANYSNLVGLIPMKLSAKSGDVGYERVDVVVVDTLDNIKH